MAEPENAERGLVDALSCGLGYRDIGVALSAGLLLRVGRAGQIHRRNSRAPRQLQRVTKHQSNEKRCILHR